ncbi:MAG: ribosome silencing factor [Phycisphaerae bacterium]|nr:ribosome silencing factor [Phycisphaerae bacterium]
MSAEPKPLETRAPDARELAVRAARAVHDHRAEDVVVLDLRGKCSVTDFFVICSGTSDRQMRAAFDAAEDAGRQCGWRPFGSAGYESATWMLLDFVDVVIHIFAPAYRQYYDLELLWGDAPRVEWDRGPGDPGGQGPNAD